MNAQMQEVREYKLRQLEHLIKMENAGILRLLYKYQHTEPFLIWVISIVLIQVKIIYIYIYT